MARASDLWVGSNGGLPEIKEPWAGEAGILVALALFQEVAPGIAVSSTTDHFNDLPSLKLDLEVREGSREVAGGTGYDTSRVFLGNNRSYRMTVKVAMTRVRGKAVSAAVVIFIPIGP